MKLPLRQSSAHHTQHTTPSSTLPHHVSHLSDTALVTQLGSSAPRGIPLWLQSATHTTPTVGSPTPTATTIPPATSTTVTHNTNINPQQQQHQLLTNSTPPTLRDPNLILQPLHDRSVSSLSTAAAAVPLPTPPTTTPNSQLLQRDSRDSDDIKAHLPPRTKIICTIGPSSQASEKMRAMIMAGMNGTTNSDSARRDISRWIDFRP